jgi:hypothetical protein
MQFSKVWRCIVPDDSNLSPLQSAWLGYTKSLRFLLVPVADDRPLDQYLQFRNDTLALVEGWEFLAGLNQAESAISSDKSPATSKPFTSLKPVFNLLLQELRAFPLAIEAAQASDKTGSENSKWTSKWLERAKTVSDSVKDLLENAPPLVKGGLTVLGELLDLFKAR